MLWVSELASFFYFTKGDEKPMKELRKKRALAVKLYGRKKVMKKK